MIKVCYSVIFIYFVNNVFFCGRGVNIVGFKIFVERSEVEDFIIFG